eukprot:COSAG02_NODE_80_length_40128_cov_591.169002_19_plen_68_part_00
MDGSESDEMEVDGEVSPAAPAETSGAIADKKVLPKTVQRCVTNPSRNPAYCFSAPLPARHTLRELWS